MASFIPLYSGYMGVAKVDNIFIRCSDFGINTSQDVLFYDHTIGLRDTVPSNTVPSTTKDESLSPSNFIQTQRRIWRPSPISISGSFSFPAATLENEPLTSGLEAIFGHAKYGTYFDIEFQYYCGIGRKFTDCRVNSFEFMISAGDIITINTSMFAKNVEDVDPSEFSHTKTEKLVTWDKVGISFTNVGNGTTVSASEHMSELSFSINNNLSNIYTSNPRSGMDNLLPRDIRVGMQEVSGSVTFYLLKGKDNISTSLDDPQRIGITVPGGTINIDVVFMPRDISGSISPIITEIPFIGVDKAFGA